jgi:hypothetical protein
LAENVIYMIYSAAYLTVYLHAFSDELKRIEESVCERELKTVQYRIYLRSSASPGPNLERPRVPRDFELDKDVRRRPHRDELSRFYDAKMSEVVSSLI